eukprot:RCo021711
MAKVAKVSPVLKWFDEYSKSQDVLWDVGCFIHDFATKHRLRYTPQLRDGFDPGVVTAMVISGLRWMVQSKVQLKSRLHVLRGKIIHAQWIFRMFMRRRDSNLNEVWQNWIVVEEAQRKAMRAQLAKDLKLCPDRAHAMLPGYAKLRNTYDDMQKAVGVVYQAKKKQFSSRFRRWASRMRDLRKEYAEVLRLLARFTPADSAYSAGLQRKGELRAEFAKLSDQKPVWRFTVSSVPIEDLASALDKFSRRTSCGATLPPLELGTVPSVVSDRTDWNASVSIAKNPGTSRRSLSIVSSTPRTAREESWNSSLRQSSVGVVARGPAPASDPQSARNGPPLQPKGSQGRRSFSVLLTQSDDAQEPVSARRESALSPGGLRSVRLDPVGEASEEASRAPNEPSAVSPKAVSPLSPLSPLESLVRSPKVGPALDTAPKQRSGSEGEESVKPRVRSGAERGSISLSLSPRRDLEGTDSGLYAVDKYVGSARLRHLQPLSRSLPKVPAATTAGAAATDPISGPTKLSSRRNTEVYGYSASAPLVSQPIGGDGKEGAPGSSGPRLTQPRARKPSLRLSSLDRTRLLIASSSTATEPSTSPDTVPVSVAQQSHREASTSRRRSTSLPAAPVDGRRRSSVVRGADGSCSVPRETISPRFGMLNPCPPATGTNGSADISVCSPVLSGRQEKAPKRTSFAVP